MRFWRYEASWSEKFERICDLLVKECSLKVFSEEKLELKYTDHSKIEQNRGVVFPGFSFEPVMSK